MCAVFLDSSKFQKSSISAMSDTYFCWGSVFVVLVYFYMCMFVCQLHISIVVFVFVFVCETRVCVAAVCL